MTESGFGALRGIAQSRGRLEPRRVDGVELLKEHNELLLDTVTAIISRDAMQHIYLN